MAAKIINFGENASSTTVSYVLPCTASVEFEKPSTVSWLTLSHNSGAKTLNISVVKNTGDSRSTTVTTKVAGTSCSSDKSIVVNQEGTSCTCDNFNVISLSENIEQEGGNAIEIGEIEDSGTCITDVTFNCNQSWISNIGINGYYITGNVSSNDSLNERSATITVGYKAHGSSCSTIEYELTQNGIDCGCGDFAIRDSSVSVAQTGGTSLTLNTITTKGLCISSISVSSNQSWATSLGVNGNSITGNVSANDSFYSRNVTVTVSYKANGTTCTAKTFTLTQSGKDCGCGDFAIRDTSVSVAQTGGTEIVVNELTSRGPCINYWDVDYDYENIPWIISMYFDEDSIVAEIESNDSFDSRSATITVNYSTDEGDCTPKTFTLTQLGKNCGCSDFAIRNSSVSVAQTGGTSLTLNTITVKGPCISDISISSSQSWATNLGVNGNSIIGNVAANDSFDSRSATITVSYKANGTTCTAKTFTLTQSGKNCDCSNFAIRDTSVPVAQTGGTSLTLNIITTKDPCISDISVSSNQSWVTSLGVNGSSITGNVAANDSFDARSATVTVSYKANGTTCTAKTFTLTQSGKACNCSNFAIRDTSVSIGQTGGTSLTLNTITVKDPCITDIIVSSNQSWATNLGTNGSSITGNVAVNDSFDSRSATITVSYKANGTTCTAKTFTLTQSGKNCDCSNFVIRDTSVSVAQTGGTSLTLNMITTKDPCITDIIVSSNQSWITSLGVNGNSITGNIAANDSFDSRSETVTVSYKANGTTCTAKTFTLTQSGKNCDCSNFAIRDSSVSVEQTGGTSLTLNTITVKDPCITDIIVSSSQSWATSLGVNGNSITGNVAANDSFDSRNATITVSYKANGTTCTAKTFTLTQYGKVCDCSNFAIRDSSVSVGQTGGTSLTLNTITTKDPCITDIIVSSNQSWATSLGANGNSITGNVAANDSFDARSATITVSYKANGTSCTAKTFTLTQSGKVCDCSNLIIDTSDVTLNAGGSSTARTLETSCTTNHTISSSNQNVARAEFIDSMSKVSITGYSSGSATITIGYKAGTNNCSKTITVNVVCPTITITPDGASGTGGTVTFTANV